MRWYQGGIAEAVSASKKSGAVFVVYVAGADNKSSELSELIDTDDISKELESDHFVAIRVEENSVPHQQFSQIYKDVTVPSIFFIGKSGSPLEVIREPQNAENFITKIRTVLQKHGVDITSKLESPKPQNSLPDSSATPTEEPSTSKKEEDSLTTEEKVERAKDLITQKRESKRIEDEEKERQKELEHRKVGQDKERQKELERRKVGQDVQKLKRWQQDEELKKLMEEREREKKENMEARQRVLQQIAQDKIERERKEFSESITQAMTQTLPQSPPTSFQSSSNTARLQFKLPDGSCHMHEFPSSSTLQEVRSYVLTNLNLPFHNFTLSTTFPRREFTNEDSEKNLIELQLVPNAVVLILPLHHGAVTTNSTSWFMALFWSVVGPILNFVGYIKNRLFGSNHNPGPKTSPLPKKRTSDDAGEPSNLPKRRPGETTAVRRQGNVHRLTDKTDSDDDNNTWNGNSTQQM